MNLRRLLMAGTFGVFLLAPMIVFGDPGHGIVPSQSLCANPGQPGGPYLQGADLVHLVQHAIQLAILLSALVATIMFVYAGFLYVTAAANAENLEKAKRVFSTVLIGFVLVLTAWLIVDLILTTLTPHKDGFGFWVSIECESFSELGDAVGSTVNTGQGGAATRSCSAPTSGLCSQSNLGAFGSSAKDASIVCSAESGGRTSIADSKSTDRLSSGEAFSIGLFQINMTEGNRPVSGSACGLASGKTLDCSQAFEGRNTSAKIVNQDLYTQCKTALELSACNIKVAKGLWSDNGNQFDGGRRFPVWTAARQCGVS